MTFTAVIDSFDDYQKQLFKCQAVINQENICQQLQVLQQIFYQTLWPQVIQADLSQSQWRSATTEIHRHMRLLAIEVNFLQSARHTQTYQQRLEQIEQRLQQLHGFTNVLINLCQKDCQ